MKKLFLYIHQPAARPSLLDQVVRVVGYTRNGVRVINERGHRVLVLSAKLKPITDEPHQPIEPHTATGKF